MVVNLSLFKHALSIVAMRKEFCLQLLYVAIMGQLRSVVKDNLISFSSFSS